MGSLLSRVYNGGKEAVVLEAADTAAENANTTQLAAEACESVDQQAAGNGLEPVVSSNSVNGAAGVATETNGHVAEDDTEEDDEEEEVEDGDQLAGPTPSHEVVIGTNGHSSEGIHGANGNGHYESAGKQIFLFAGP